MQHRRGRGRGGIRLRRPGVKRGERDQNAENDKEQEGNILLRVRCDLTGGCFQRGNVERAQSGRHALIEQNQSKQENETPDREIDRDLPGRGVAIAASPNADEQKRRDERKLVKCVKEKEIERRKRADRATGDEKQARVKGVFVIVDLAGKPNRRQRHDRGQQNHDQIQTVQSDGETETPLGRNWKRPDKLKIARSLEQEKREKRQSKDCDRGAGCCFARWRPYHDRNSGDDWNENEKQEHQWKMAK